MLNHDSDDENTTFVDMSLNNLVVLSEQHTIHNAGTFWVWIDKVEFRRLASRVPTPVSIDR